MRLCCALHSEEGGVWRGSRLRHCSECSISSVPARARHLVTTLPHQLTATRLQPHVETRLCEDTQLQIVAWYWAVKFCQLRTRNTANHKTRFRIRVPIKLRLRFWLYGDLCFYGARSTRFWKHSVKWITPSHLPPGCFSQNVSCRERCGDFCVPPSVMPRLTYCKTHSIFNSNKRIVPWTEVHWLLMLRNKL